MSKQGEPRVDSTLSKGLAVLECLSASRKSMGVSELSRALGLTKSNTFRLLQTLRTLGYVRHEVDKSYSATLKTWQVGRSAVENLNLRSVAAPWLDYLSEQTGETIYLAVRNGLEVIYIDKRESQKAIRSWNPIGGTAPVYCVGTGKALLAAEYAALRPRLAEALQAYTDQTITDLDALDADMQVTRMRGHAVDEGEFRAKIYSYGAVIRLPDGAAAGALGVSVPNVNLETGDSDRIGALVQHAATAVTEALERL